MNIAKLNLPLVYFTISLHCPSPTKQDKSASAKLANEANAESGVYRVQKERIPKRFHKPISSVQQRIRKYFEDECFRMDHLFAIPVSRYQSFMAGLANLEREHESHVTSLCEAIESGILHEEAKRRQGDDFDPTSLPADCVAVRSAIRIAVRQEADLSSHVLQEALQDLGGEVAKEVEEAVRREQADALSRGQSSIVGKVMGEVVGMLSDMGEKCEAGEPRTHYKTLVERVRRVVEELPAYNVTNDPRITSAIQMVGEHLGGIDKDLLRDSETYRKGIASKVKKIRKDLDEMGGDLF